MGGDGLEALSIGHKLSIDDYKTIIDILYQEHENHCKSWIVRSEYDFNFKNTNVCDIYSSHNGFNEDFYKHMSGYLKSIHSLHSKILYRINEECNIFIIGRWKSPDSIIQKLYYKNKYDFGKFPVIKCLNDLLGFRIIDDNYCENKHLIIRHLEQLKENKFKIRHVDRNLDEYKAYHVYLIGDNRYFPTELQIWDSSDAQSNMESHILHKQMYISWIEEYNNI